MFLAHHPIHIRMRIKDPSRVEFTSQEWISPHKGPLMWQALPCRYITIATCEQFANSNRMDLMRLGFITYAHMSPLIMFCCHLVYYMVTLLWLERTKVWLKCQWSSAEKLFINSAWLGDAHMHQQPRPLIIICIIVDLTHRNTSSYKMILKLSIAIAPILFLLHCDNIYILNASSGWIITRECFKHLITKLMMHANFATWAPSQYKDRLICVWRFPC